LKRRWAALLFCLLAACVGPRVPTVPQAPADVRLEDARVITSDGASLPLRRWQPAHGPTRGVVLALHGLNEHAGWLGATGDQLAASGFAVYSYDQRGFGGTAERGKWVGGDLLADDAWQAAKLLRARYPDVPLYAVGESMGSAVLLHALARHDGRWLDGAVLLAPAVWSRSEMPWYQRGALWSLAHSWRGLRLSSSLVRRQPTDNPDVRRQMHDDPVMIHKTRVDVLSGVADLMDTVTAQRVPTSIPLLILAGARDEIVPPAATCHWVASLDVDAPWQFAVYPNGWHLLTRDRDAALVQADLVAWLEHPTAPLPSGLDARPAPCPARPSAIDAAVVAE
jgi:alpha-beta hydrolase superfamily lysophospholipase